MLTLRLLGFFSLFRKRNLSPAGVCAASGVGVRARNSGGFRAWHTATRPAFLMMLALVFCAAMLLAQPPAQAASPEEEEGRPYIGRDYEGNRIFGTDDKSDAGFARDLQTGDRTFKTAPSQKQEDQSGYSGPVWVTPEVTPGRPPSGWQRPPSGNSRPPR